MAELIAKTPCDGLLPLQIGGVRLTEVPPAALTLISPWPGRDRALDAVLRAAHDLGLPGPGRATGRSGKRAIWFGRGQILLAGPDPDAALAEHAALSDQSDGWAVVDLEGDAAPVVLARLVPVDLRPTVFRRGHTARTQLGQLHVSLTRLGVRRWRIMAFRSMAHTLVHELQTAMEAVAARG
ncbi:sarcosine oxidase subunit gamma [Pukyongiella litopenaei]|uniref:Sarcosine oxidase subunit gamma n=1 Tax=Pukyongiella litopenaei TaxID=2605946 RepID=A0A2S0MKA3_9RHOB|nr:sarcosine oxidase subunit gamma [Pukyongiella litopenaei]AVO36257.1 sarcosine oxidase subunit gamma [Pukyongiella litopenaei]